MQIDFLRTRKYMYDHAIFVVNPKFLSVKTDVTVINQSAMHI